MTVDNGRAVPPTVCSDPELIVRTRAGDREAFAELYRRHEGAALMRARQLLRSSSDCEDVVADAFARILGLLTRGAGPDDDFRPYLLACVRNGCADRGRGARTIAVDPSEMADTAEAHPSEFTERIETTMVLKEAFATVPSRWQQVLWHTEVEDRSLDEVSEELELSPAAVASLSYRARRALGVAYLDAYRSSPTRPRCVDNVAELGGYVRKNLSRRARMRVEAHLLSCANCRTAVNELGELDRAMRA